MATDKPLRSFVALALPGDCTRQLAQQLVEFKQAFADAQLRWIPQPNWHLTLAFLGDQTLDTLTALEVELQQALVNQRPFAAPIYGIGGFPDAKSAVVAVRVEPTASLLKIQGDVRQCCDRCGIALDKRRFKPHITVARLKKAYRIKAEERTFELPVVWSRLALYTSRLIGEGSIYQEIATITLATN